MTLLKRTIASTLTSTSVALAALQMAIGAPATAFDVAEPPAQARPDEPKSIDAGDASVSTQTGAFEYVYNVAVPPGRGGDPAVSLSYSSQGAVYGGVAAGWSLNAGAFIEVDPTAGRAFAYPLDDGPPLITDDTRFRSSLAGLQQLVPVDEFSTSSAPKTYRAMFDTSYAQYRRQAPGSTFAWEVRVPGRTYQFGHAAHIAGAAPETRWPLTKEIDDFDNEIHYFWHGGDSLDISAIEYTINDEARLTDPHARIEFEYDANSIPTTGDCSDLAVPIGASSDYRSGELRLDGRRKLTSIVTRALHTEGGLRNVRKVELRYYDGSQGAPFDSEVCDQLHGPQRLLWQIEETAYAEGASANATGAAVDLPPVTFEYGPIARSLTHTFDATLPATHADEPAAALVWGHRYESPSRWPTVEAMLLDVDTDGFIDRLAMVDKTNCTVEVQRGGPSGFTPAWTFSLPRIPWRDEAAGPDGNEECSLAGQRSRIRTIAGAVSNGTYYAYRFLNLLGNDEHPDLVTALHYQPDVIDISAATGLPQLGLPAPSCDSPADHDCPQVDRQCVRDLHQCRELNHGEICPAPTKLCIDLAPDVRCDVLFAQNDGNDSNGDGCEDGWHPDPSQDDVCIKDRDDNSPPPVDCAIDPVACHCGLTSCGGGGDRVVVVGEEPSSGNASRGVRRASHIACGSYVWYVYRNLGDGHFDTSPEIVYSPLPLETNGGTSSLGGGPRGMSSSEHALIDLNGDGHLDAVAVDSLLLGQSLANSPYWWYVFYGDGDGGFRGQPDGKPYIWWVPNGARPSASLQGSGFKEGDPRALRVSIQQYGLFDINADGLPDLLRRDSYGSNARTRVYLNHGLGFFSEDPGNFDRLSVVRRNEMLPTYEHWLRFVEDRQNPYIYDADGYLAAGIVDYDADGRLDFYFPTRATDDLDPDYGVWLPKLAFNAGSRILSNAHKLGSSYADVATVPERIYFDTDRWWVTRRYVDVTGDGRGDVVRATTNPRRMKVTTDAGGPLRLLRTVDTGRGAKLDLAYAPHTDSDAVVQNPELGKSTPSPTWVVTSMRATDRWSNIDATTTYEYFRPAVTADWRGQSRFRGFEQVVVRAATGSVAVDNYGYDIDPTGRGTGTVTYENEADYSDAAESATALAASKPHSVDRVFWTEYPVRTGVRTYHASASTTWVCSQDQSHADCTQGDAQTSVVNTWSPARDTTGTIATYFLKRRAEYAGAIDVVAGKLDLSNYTAHDDDRVFVGTYTLRSSADEYRLLKHHSIVAKLSPYEVVRDELTEYDTTGRLPLRTKVWMEDSRWATTVRGFEKSTGLLLWTQKPAQFADPQTRISDDETYDPCADPDGLGAPVSCVEYDEPRLFPAAVRNELGHTVEFDYDYATGQVVESRGPNAGQKTRTHLDGLGRVVAVETNDDSNGTVVAEISRTAYDEGSPTRRPSVKEEALVTWGGQWSTTTTYTDAGGRPVERIVSLAADDLPNSVATFAYDDAGRLTGMTVPDPSKFDTGTVAYAYGYDNLGRPTSSTPPLGATTQTTYDGRWTRSFETFSRLCPSTGCPPTDEPLARKEILADAFGRASLVRELVAEPDKFAETGYAYDAADEVASITDAEGHVTALVHDGAGNRREVRRGTKVWAYEYDDSGNVLKEIAPHKSPATRDLHTTSFTYDALDRIESRLSGLRGLSAADRDDFGSNLIEYFYDECAPDDDPCSAWGFDDQNVNLIGRLRQVKTAYNTTLYAYDVRGNAVWESRSFELPAQLGGFKDRRWAGRSFTPQGQVSEAAHPDGYWLPYAAPGSSLNATRIQYRFDARGAAKELLANNDGGTFLPRIRVARNRAGLPWQQFANDTDRDLQADPCDEGCLARTWQYDVLGRVIEDRLAQPDKLIASVKYWKAGDTRSITTDFGPSVSYYYDSRHQVTEAYEDGDTFTQSALSYTLAGRLSSAKIATQATSSNARDRDVTYVYPSETGFHEQVGELTDVDSDSPFASYTYDLQGNVTERHVDGEGTYYLHHDGDDRLRKLVYPDGSSETYYYDHTAARQFALQRNTAGTATSLRFWFGAAEIRYGASGKAEETRAYAGLGGSTTLRVVDHSTDQFLHHNGLGHLLAATDYYGEILASFSYTAFGEVSEQAGSTSTFDRLFNGKQIDPASGISYYGFRYYDPLSMTWLRADPKYRFAPDLVFEEPRRRGLYTFSLNNPLRYVDPDGLDCVPQGADIPTGDKCGRTQSEKRTAESVARRGGTVAPAAEKVVGTVVQYALVEPLCLLAGCNDAHAPTPHSNPQPRRSTSEEVKRYAAFAVGGFLAGVVSRAVGRVLGGSIGRSSAASTAGTVAARGGDETVDLIRAVHHPSSIRLVQQQRRVVPRGGSASVQEHTMGSNTASNYTSWLPDTPEGHRLARRHATLWGRTGIVVRATVPTSRVITPPRTLDPGEVLIEGVVENVNRIW